ncbi:hypothetical protein K4H02_22175, partial [Mycobacterium tuberculosis]|nr:hypothetical protein [Mycobacterium tuberculosis]
MTTPRRIIPLAAIGASLLLLASAVTAADTVLHPFLVAQPAQAPQPWLPLQSLQLRYTSAPTSARTGEAANVVVEAVAEGATRAQFT